MAVGVAAAVVVAGAVIVWAVGRPGAATPRATATSTAKAVVATVAPAAPTLSATATSTPSAADAVSAAYLAYWAAYAHAVRTLDASGLAAAMTGPMLDRRRAEVAQLKQQGQAVEIQVEHHFVIARLDASAGTATVIDDYSNSSYIVDPSTGDAVNGQPTPTTLSDTYYLVREDGRWKVSDGVRTVIANQQQ